MTPIEFKTSAQRIFGKSGWKGQLAEALCVNRSTIWRYTSGERPIPESVALALEALANRERA